jgi:phenylacetate-CoA ligase
MRLPFLFLFGRRDSTVSYMGANIYPQDVEYGLYTGNPHAHLIAGFGLELVEDADLRTRPVVNIRLRAGATVDRQALARVLADGVVAHLAGASRDFAESLREDPSAARIEVRVFDHDDGPFAGADHRIKNVYLMTGAR